MKDWQALLLLALTIWLHNCPPALIPHYHRTGRRKPPFSNGGGIRPYLLSKDLTYGRKRVILLSTQFKGE